MGDGKIRSNKMKRNKMPASFPKYFDPEIPRGNPVESGEDI